jgi:putative nucleotidyltransferase with HDIG domain
MNLLTTLQDFAEDDIRTQIRIRVQRCDNLPSIPRVIDTIVSLVEDINASLDALETAIMHDLSCTARLLQMANSAFYGSTRMVTSIRRAILLLGFNTINNVATKLQVFNSFIEHNTSEIASINGLWLHSLAVAMLSKRIAHNVSQYDIDVDLAFCAGLLHDIGRVVLLQLFPEDYLDLLAQIQHNPELNLVKAERQTFHVTHTNTGLWLAEAWHLPAPILHTIAYHHHAHTAHPLVMTVMLADHIAKVQRIGLTDGQSPLANPNNFAKALNLPPKCLEQCATYIQTEADNLQRTFLSNV